MERLATERQIAALQKVFAPEYTEWKTWATERLSFADADRWVGWTIGMTQNDLHQFCKRYKETNTAFMKVRQEAAAQGFVHYTLKSL